MKRGQFGTRQHIADTSLKMDYVIQGENTRKERRGPGWPWGILTFRIQMEEEKTVKEHMKGLSRKVRGKSARYGAAERREELRKNERRSQRTTED